MPEGIEVAHLVDWLNYQMKDKVLNSIELLTGRYLKHGPPKGFISFSKALPLKILNVQNQGKFIWIELKDNWSIWITLGMSGHLGLGRTAYARSRFDFDRGKPIYFNDLRNFGTLRFTNYPDLLEEKLQTLGPDPIRDQITFEDFLVQWKKQKSSQKVGTMLLKQNFIAGIGNYLRAEILYDAGIDPHCRLEDIPLKFVKALWKSILKVFDMGYKNKPYHYNFKVYRQKKDPKGNPVLGEKFYTRTMWWSPESVKLRCSKQSGSK